jgi:hypothetical protein
MNNFIKRNTEMISLTGEKGTTMSVFQYFTYSNLGAAIALLLFSPLIRLLAT